METIIVKAIERKSGGIVVVKYNGNREATLNDKWQKQECDFLEQKVGVGGEVEVEIMQKGQYTNITKVNFDNYKPSQNPIKIDDKKPEIKPVTTFRDDVIVAQVILKAATEVEIKEMDDNEKFNPERFNLLCQEMAGAYKATVSTLNQ